MQKALGSERKFQRNNAAVLLFLCALEGIGAFIGSIISPSEPGSAVLFGLSKMRLVMSGSAALLIVGVAFLAWSAYHQTALWRNIARRAEQAVQSPARSFAVFTAFFTLFLAVLSVLLLAVGPAANELTLLKTILSRMGYLLIWAAFILLQVMLFILLDDRTSHKLSRISTPLRVAVLLAAAALVYLVFLKMYLAATWDTRLRGVEYYIFLPSLLLIAWGMLQKRQIRGWNPETVERLMMLLFIGVTVYTLYWHTAQWAKFEETRDSFTWHLLAQSFLDGRLYLENPSSLHDMTFYNGEWYVPSPPLPAIVLMPLIAILGMEHVNMVQFTIFVGSANAVIIYAMLAEASRRTLIPTHVSGNLWLTTLVVFGTNHWWLSTYGVFWYLSQLLTLLFASLAVLLALKRLSPWWIGLCLGLAILSRPNVFTLWPLLAGITIYLILQETGRIPWKKMFFWAVQSAVPVIGAVGGLLFYNYLRFGDLMDFGYVTVNSSPWIMDAVRTYGMFNIHFLPINIEMMFFHMPTIELQGQRIVYSPGVNGTSIIAMTPAVIYLFRRFKLNWWTAGAWASTLITAGLLLLYHNTGAWQLGYRYLMDFILPVILLIAANLGSRTSPIFKALVLFSILINGINIHWWFTNQVG